MVSAELEDPNPLGSANISQNQLKLDLNATTIVPSRLLVSTRAIAITIYS